MITSSQSHDAKAFNEAYDKINEFSNFKYNFVSWFNKLQDTATELDSKDIFLRTWSSLLNYGQRLNIQFNQFFSLCNAYDWLLKNTNFTASQYGKPFRLTLSNVLHNSKPAFCIWATSLRQIWLKISLIPLVLGLSHQYKSF